ncbi:MAG TPA: O-antigen ligase family protein [Vicinamibacterales bacterium]|jgi:O-antigen ligase|nr:O-antigen ligase family protein [Vicinamibacterales bacterium]
MTTTTTALQAPMFQGDKLEVVTIGALVGFLAASQLSVAPAYIMLAITFACWAAVLRVHHERIQVPTMFWWLAAYGVATVFSALNSANPTVSLVDCKQLVLFLIVPLVYRFARGSWALTFATVIITVGALGALIGIAQFGLLHFDNLSHRPHGSLSHYMTYSGVLMLVACAAAARLVFRREGTHFLGGSRTWTVLVMPALIVALALTFTRSAWVGLVAGIGVLIVLKDRRLFAAIPLVVALTILVAPTSVTARMYSMFDVNDPSNKDRVAMLESGVEMVRDHPLTGVGPDMVKSVYKEYRQPWAVNELNVHLHNVPVHIAAERGLPALLLWIGFIVYLGRDLIRRVTTSRQPSLAAGALAAVAAMLAAGLFEYNFGDSEFLMLFLVLITLPYASDRTADDADAR